jgi:hypothetical protein
MIALAVKTLELAISLIEASQREVGPTFASGYSINSIRQIIADLRAGYGC